MLLTYVPLYFRRWLTYYKNHFQVSRNLLSLMEEEALEAVRSSSGQGGRQRKPWDDDFVLKRQFSALIPAFDPRPGRTNLNQTVGKKLMSTIFVALN